MPTGVTGMTAPTRMTLCRGRSTDSGHKIIPDVVVDVADAFCGNSTSDDRLQVGDRSNGSTATLSNENVVVSNSSSNHNNGPGCGSDSTRSVRTDDDADRYRHHRKFWLRRSTGVGHRVGPSTQGQLLQQPAAAIRPSRSLPVKMSSLVAAVTAAFSDALKDHRQHSGGADGGSTRSIPTPTSSLDDGADRQSSASSGGGGDGCTSSSGRFEGSSAQSEFQTQQLRLSSTSGEREAQSSFSGVQKQDKLTQTDEQTLSEEQARFACQMAGDSSTMATPSVVNGETRLPITNAAEGAMRSESSPTHETPPLEGADDAKESCESRQNHDEQSIDSETLLFDQMWRNAELTADVDSCSSLQLPSNQRVASLASVEAVHDEPKNVDRRDCLSASELANIETRATATDAASVCGTRQRRRMFIQYRRQQTQQQRQSNSSYPASTCSFDDILHGSDRLLSEVNRDHDFQAASSTYPRGSVRGGNDRCVARQNDGDVIHARRNFRRAEVGDNIPTTAAGVQQARNLRLRHNVNSCSSAGSATSAAATVGGNGSTATPEQTSATRAVLIRGSGKSSTIATTTAAQIGQCRGARSAWSKSQEFHPVGVVRASTMSPSTLTAGRRRNSVHAVFVEASPSDVVAGGGGSKSNNLVSILTHECN